MEALPLPDLDKLISWYRQKINYNALCGDRNKYTRSYINEFGDVAMPAEALIKHQLVSFMRDIGLQFSKLKKDTDFIANKWEDQINTWLKENNWCEKNLKILSTAKKSPSEEKSLDGTGEFKHRNSESDYGQNSQSSNSCESDSSDLRKSISNDRSSDNQPSRKSFSPLEPENPTSSHSNVAQFNANLHIDCIDPNGLASSNEYKPSKKTDKFLELDAMNGLFKARQLKRPYSSKGLETFLNVCQLISLPSRKYPGFLKEYRDYRNQEKSDCNVGPSSLKRIDQSIDPHNLPSTSRHGSMETLRVRNLHSDEVPESKKCDKKKKECPDNKAMMASNSSKKERTSVHYGGRNESLNDTAMMASMSSKKERTSVCYGGKNESPEDKSPMPVMPSKKERTSVYPGGKNESPEDKSPMAPTKKERTSVCNGGRNECSDDSAMIAIMSSKKERTNVYHGVKNDNVPKLKTLCVHYLTKMFKQRSDAAKYITKDVPFDILKPMLVLLPPWKLYKLEEEKKHLLEHTDIIWKEICMKGNRSLHQRKRDNETWRGYFQRLRTESDARLRTISASITASQSRNRPERQIMLMNAEAPPPKRPKMDHQAIIPKNNGIHVAAKPLPISNQPSKSKPAESVPPKSVAKPVNRTIKKDAPLMHKAKKTLGHLNRIHRN